MQDDSGAYCGAVPELSSRGVPREVATATLEVAGEVTEETEPAVAVRGVLVAQVAEPARSCKKQGEGSVMHTGGLGVVTSANKLWRERRFQ